MQKLYARDARDDTAVVTDVVERARLAKVAM
jgi:hypothetical protein